MRFRIMTGQLMVIGRTVRGPKMPLWRGLRCHCPITIFLVSCIFFNKCLYFQIAWLCTFWTDLLNRQNNIENPRKRITHYGELICNKGSKAVTKNRLPTNNAIRIRYPYAKTKQNKKIFDTYLKPHMQINSKSITVLNIKTKMKTSSWKYHGILH